MQTSQPEQCNSALNSSVNTMSNKMPITENSSNHDNEEQSHIQTIKGKNSNTNNSLKENNSLKDSANCSPNFNDTASPSIMADEKSADKANKSKGRRNRELDKLEDSQIIHSRLRSESGKVYSTSVTLDSNTTASLEALQEEAADMCSKDCCRKSDQIISMITKLQSSIDDMTTRFTNQEARQDDVIKRVDGLEQKTTTQENDIQELNTELNETKFQLKLITNIVAKQDQQIGFLSNKITEMQQREMTSNVVITGIPENKRERPIQVFNEFVSKQLELQELIPVHRAFRVGSGSNRPLIAELRDADHKRKLFANATRLKGKKNPNGGYFFLSEHLPDKLNEDRRRVNQLFSENKKKPAGFQLDMELNRGALSINQEPYRKAVQVPSIKNMIRPSDDMYAKAMDMDIIKGKEATKNSSKFASFAVAVKDFDEINAAFLKIKMKYADATHISCAYRLPGANTPLNQDYVDDGEFGCGRTMLKVMKDQGLMNVAVFMVRYYGGFHLGVQRFTIFRDLSEAALHQLLSALKSQGIEPSQIPQNLKIPTTPDGWNDAVEELETELGKKTD